MSMFVQGVGEIVNYLIHTDFTDPRTRHWFWSGLWPPIILIIVYQYFVKCLGPRLMKNRAPFKLDRVLIVYNLCQILFSVYIVYRVIVVCYIRTNYSLLCQPVDPSTSPEAMEEAVCVWLYYMAKISDLMDTVFFVLRKKFRQISFLHVYHHTGMIIAGVIGVRYIPGGHAISLGGLNSLVHAVMYTYYLLSSIYPSITGSKWKKYITQLQMIQFLCLVCHFSLPFVYPCGYPLWPCTLIVPQYLFMFGLFYDFYRKAYSTPKQAKQA